VANSELKKLDKATFQLTITIPWADVAKTYDQVITDAVKEAELPGFRKGAAPRDRVEPTLDKKKTYEETVQRSIPTAYVEAVRQHGLRPILNPRVELKSVKEGEDWVFIAMSCEAPEVKLGDYRAEVKKALATDSLWVPGKGDPTKKEEPDKDQKLNKIIDHLLSVIAIEPSDMLVEEESNHALARLVDQTQQLGITVEQYLASTNKTPEALRAEYAVSSKRNLQTEFLLNEISKDLKIQVADKEIDEVVNTAPDQKSRESLNTPSQRAVISAIMARRHALDTLLTFA
jgi:FKBP-type peptidyl-prolyl cis-trans isomerase (trigger factor)